jgi:hypothetical protein
MEKDIQKSKETDHTELQKMTDIIRNQLLVAGYDEHEQEKEYTYEQIVEEGKKIYKLFDKIISKLENTPVNGRQKDDEESLLYIKSTILETKAASDVAESIKKNVKNYAVVFLTLNAINFFHIMNDIMFYRSTMKWSGIIQDTEMLSQMYSFVYSKIVEI